MSQPIRKLDESLLEVLLDDLADRLALRLSAVVPSPTAMPTTPWLTTDEAIEYTRLPAGTFRKLAACGKIPAHGNRSKVFYRPELDQALLEYTGLGEEDRMLRTVR